MDSILRIYVPSILRAVTQHTEILEIMDSKVTYISWSGSLSSQNWEFMKLEIVRLIIQLTTVTWNVVYFDISRVRSSLTVKTSIC